MENKLTDTLSRLVAFYPVSKNQESVKSLLKYCQTRLSATKGFKVNKVVNHNGFHSLYVATTQTKVPKVLLQAHVDVVPALEHLHTTVLKDNRFIGRGVFDMLFAAAAFLELSSEIARDLPNLNFGILLTGDEELGGLNGVEKFVDDGYGADIVILPDAGRRIGTINTGSKGVYGFDLIVDGVAHHGSRPWEGDGAGNKIVATLSEILALTKNDQQSSFTIVVTTLSGGDSINKGPANASAHLDIRYRDDQALEELKTQLPTILKKHGVKIDNMDEAVAFNLDLEHPAVKKFLKIYESHVEDGIEQMRAEGTSDARFFVAKQVPVIMFRPLGGGAHSDEEWIDIAEFNKFYEILKRYVLNVAKI